MLSNRSRLLKHNKSTITTNNKYCGNHAEYAGEIWKTVKHGNSSVPVGRKCGERTESALHQAQGWRQTVNPPSPIKTHSNQVPLDTTDERKAGGLQPGNPKRQHRNRLGQCRKLQNSLSSNPKSPKNMSRTGKKWTSQSYTHRHVWSSFNGAVRMESYMQDRIWWGSTTYKKQTAYTATNRSKQ
jgi:hypothetical protein